MIRLLLTALLLQFAAPLPTFAETLIDETGPSRRSTPDAPPGLSDRDGNGLSDDFQAKLDQARPNELFDVIVTFDGPGDVRSARQAVGSFRVRREFDVIDGFSATMSAAQARGLAATPGVFRVEEDFEVRVELEFARDAFGVDRVHDALSGLGLTGSGSRVCVIDTGADVDHEQLDDKSIGSCWRDFVADQPLPYDDHGHGTHVTNICCGDGVGGPDAETYRGVAPEAEVCSAKVLNSDGSATATAIIDAIGWCADQGADVINMSLGTLLPSDGSDSISQAVDAVSDRVIPVVAAGNSGSEPGSIGSPGCAEHAISVGALANWARDGEYLAGFSSRGPCNPNYDKPDVTAPGVRIRAAEANSSDGQGYITFSGTSMATPFMAGTAALAVGADSTLVDPAISSTDPLPVERLRALLEVATVDRGPSGPDPDWGIGELDAYLLACAATGAPDCVPTPLPTYERIAGSVQDHQIWEHEVFVDADDLDVNLGATLDIEGQFECRIVFIYFVCSWAPDLEAELVDPSGAVIASSACPATGECGQAGRWETLHASPTEPGLYTIRVFPAEDDFNQGEGGNFHLDVASGPLVATGTPSPPPPPPPSNNPPVAVADAVSTEVDSPVTIAVLANDSDPDNDPLSVSLVTSPSNGAAQLNTATNEVTFTPNAGFVGSDLFSYTASDGNGGSDSANVDVAVVAGPAEAAIHVGDIDGFSTNHGKTWTATVTIAVHDHAHDPVSGVTVAGNWSTGESVNCMTASDGQCSLTSGGVRKKEASITFSVQDLTHNPPLDYLSSNNHDPEGDSDGTAIIVAKP